jgi:hypothetical protein
MRKKGYRHGENIFHHKIDVRYDRYMHKGRQKITKTASVNSHGLLRSPWAPRAGKDSLDFPELEGS